MQAEFCKIDYRDALKMMIQSKTRNRKLNEKKIKKIRDDIVSGRWVVNGEAIIFDKENNIIDGHHRLVALSQTKEQIESLVVRGCPIVAMKTVDIGQSRNLADQFEMILGVTGTIPRIINAMRIAITGSSTTRSGFINFDDASDFYHAHENCVRWVLQEGFAMQPEQRIRKPVPIRRFNRNACEIGFVWACLGLIWDRSPSLAYEIIDQFDKHHEGNSSETMSALMKVLLHNHLSPTARVGRSWFLPRIIIGMNHFINGTTTSRIVFRNTEWPKLKLDEIDAEAW